MSAIVAPATRRRRFLRGSLALASAALLGHAAALPRAVARGPWVTRRALAFGTRVSVTVAALPPNDAAAAADAALAAIAAVDVASALHRIGSPLAALNRAGAIVDAPHTLVELLQQARHWGALTEGAFDVTVQPLWRLYFEASARGAFPEPGRIEQVRDAIDWRAIELDGHHVRLAAPGMQVTLNGLSQGHAADAAYRVLQARGVEHALVDAGEWRALGERDFRSAWRIGVRAPRRDVADLLDVVDLRDAALATSGDDGFSFTSDRRLHHILDPRSGTSPPELAAATVLAPNAATADALSTACMVLGIERSLALASRLPGVHLLLVRKDGVLASSPDWPGRRRLVRE